MGKIQKKRKFVPHELSQKNKDNRVEMCLNLYNKQHRKSYLWKIVTDPGQPSTSTPKRNIHDQKVMLCIWWDMQDVLYYEQPRETVDGDRHSRQLLRLNEEIRRKRPYTDKGLRPVKLLHDNARPHVAKTVKETLLTLGWDVLPHQAPIMELFGMDSDRNNSVFPRLSLEVENLAILRHERERQRLAEIHASQIMRRRLRDMLDPFALPENEFMGMYRLTRNMTRILVETLEPYLSPRRRALGIPNELKVLCALNFYAQGSYQKAVGVDSRLSIAQPTVSVILQEITSAINNYLLRQWIRFPTTLQEIQQIVQSTKHPMTS
nr:PREDICTED: uncharacterized protein LOC105669078 [Linepithema humile]